MKYAVVFKEMWSLRKIIEKGKHFNKYIYTFFSEAHS